MLGFSCTIRGPVARHEGAYLHPLLWVVLYINFGSPFSDAFVELALNLTQAPNPIPIYYLLLIYWDCCPCPKDTVNHTASLLSNGS